MRKIRKHLRIQLIFNFTFYFTRLFISLHYREPSFVFLLCVFSSFIFTGGESMGWTRKKLWNWESRCKTSIMQRGDNQPIISIKAWDHSKLR